MTPLEVKKLEMYKKRIGDMTVDEALQLALEAEQIAKDCGPFDVAYSTFKGQQEGFENYALLLEKAEHEQQAIQRTYERLEVQGVREAGEEIERDEENPQFFGVYAYHHADASGIAVCDCLGDASTEELAIGYAKKLSDQYGRKWKVFRRGQLVYEPQRA